MHFRSIARACVVFAALGLARESSAAAPVPSTIEVDDEGATEVISSQAGGAPEVGPYVLDVSSACEPPRGEDGHWEELPSIPLAWRGLVYDEVLGDLIVLGGGDSWVTNEVRRLRLDGPAGWQPICATGPPPPPAKKVLAAIDSDGRRVFVYAGEGSRSGPIYPLLDTLWVLRLDEGPSWEPVAILGGSPVRYPAAIYYDQRHDRVLMMGRLGYCVGFWSLEVRPGASWQAAGQPLCPCRYYSLSAGTFDSRSGRYFTYGENESICHHDYCYEDYARCLKQIAPLEGAGAPSVLTSASVPSPEPRIGEALAYDSRRNRIYLHGGLAGTTLADEWQFEEVPGAGWSRIPAGSAAVTPGAWRRLHYDGVRDRLILVGGHQSEGIWVRPAAASGDAWSPVQGAPVRPTASREHATVLDRNARRLLMYGGHSAVGTPGLWELSLDADSVWREVVTAGPTPAPRGLHAAVFDPVSRRVIVDGGRVGRRTTDEVWAFEVDARRWVELRDLPGHAPPARENHSAVLDPVSRRMLVFNKSWAPPTPLAVWALSLDGELRWDSLAVNGDPPPWSDRTVAVYDPDHHRVFFMAGFATRYWVLDLTTSPPRWMEVPSGLGPDNVDNGAAAFDDSRGRVVVIPRGGLPRAWTTGGRDLGEWAPLRTSGVGPDVHDGATLTYDPDDDRFLYVYSGRWWELRRGLPLLEVTVAPIGGADEARGTGREGELVVVLMGSASLEVSRVDPGTLVLAGASVARDGQGRPKAEARDRDHDGRPDLVVHFDWRDAAPGRRLVLRGQLVDGRPIRGILGATPAPGAGHASRSSAAEAGANAAASGPPPRLETTPRGLVRLSSTFPGGSGTIEILDLAGRRVSSTEFRSLPGGTTSEWFELGVKLRPGLYFVRARIGGQESTARMVRF